MLGLEINETLKDNPYFKKAMEYARMTDLSELPLGKHVLDSKNLWLTIIEMPLKAREEARLEASTANTEEDILKLCNFKNLQLLKAKDNLDKKDKLNWEVRNDKDEL